MFRETEKRKLSHIEMSLRKEVQSQIGTGFEDVQLIHKALPEINKDEIDLTSRIFEFELRAPIILESMTGGTPSAARINAILAEAAESFQIGIGVGSQRAAIEDPRLAYTYQIVRKKAPTAMVFANLGCPQLTKGYGKEEIQKAIEMVHANALMIHVNPLQESVQLEGETNFRGSLNKIREIADEVDVPVIVKETGAGISREVARAIETTGVDGIDVAGAGGTSWAAVEYHRAREIRNRIRERLGKTFWSWGIPTAASVIEVTKSTGLTVLASGGIRNGLHIAKAIALGAKAAGLAHPALRSAVIGRKNLREMLSILIEELKTAMFLTGSKDLNQLMKAPLVITGELSRWLEQRGVNTQEYARRTGVS